ncbi:MAG: ABC transporter transmembrane domain-containing protein, partial [Clostridia bacterium]|nr:ABC transporter transmembrane domain-containing protein [Clostridia bacterium]
MKPYIKILKWVIGQSRSYMFPVILITVLGTILSFCYVLTAILSKNLIDAAAEKNIHQAVQAASAFSVIILMKVGIQSSVSILSARTFEKLSNSIRQGLFSRIIHSQWLDITKYHSEDVLTRMTSDVGILSNGIVNILPGIVSLGIRLLAALAALLAMEPMLAVLTFVLAPCAILLSHFLGQKFKDYHIKIQESEGRYRTFIQEQ